MTKLTLTNVSNLANEGSAVSTMALNNAAIIASVENTLSRDGTAPNQMLADLDMNGHRILNLPIAISGTEPVTLNDLNSKAVRYDIVQTLNPTQQQQARENIGATAGAGSSGGSGSGVTSFNTRDGLVVSVAGDYTASQITNVPAGTIAATNVQTAIDELRVEKAELNSPTFTGIPAAPTAAPATNTTQIATTAYVEAAGTSKANLAGPTFTGDPKAPTPAPGDNDTSLATTAFVTAAVSGVSSAPSPPQGRLTLVSATPVMTTTQAAKTTIFYTPYVGGYIPLYNGTIFTMTAFAELSQGTTDTTKSPAAVANNSNYDMFVWSDGGTMRCTRGPAWASDTTRGTGAGTTELLLVNGIWLNTVAITNGPAASRGTYVGSVRSNGSAQIDWTYGTVALNWGAAFLYVYNLYNKVRISSFNGDTTNSWTYGTQTWRAANGNTNTSRTSWINGIVGGDIATGSYHGDSVADGTTTRGVTGVGFNVTNAFTGSTGVNGGISGLSTIARASVQPTLGLNFFAPLEIAETGGTNIYIGDNNLAFIQTGMWVDVNL